MSLQLISKVRRLQSLSAQRAQQAARGSQSGNDDGPVWQPFPGPQTLAYYHPADELFYGGAGGSGKTDLLLGVAGTAHRRALILRREFPRARAIIERSREIFARGVASHSKDSFNESLHLWRLADNRTIEIGAIQQEKDWQKYQGQAHDLKAFDEITEFTEKQFRSINIWNRSADPDTRVRVVATGNPPTTIEGEWVIDYWAPFLDSDHPEPAEPGSLVWYVRVKTEDGDRDLEVGRTPLDEVQRAIDAGAEIPRPTYEAPNGKVLTARSRSFVPGRVEDNPVLMARGYDEQLEALPEDLRERFRYGLFVRVVESQELQVIPTDWIVQAQERWKRYMGWESKELPKTKEAIALLKQRNPNAVQTAIGADPSRGGSDDACVAPVYGDWVAPVYAFSAKHIQTGRDMALKIAEVREDNALVKIDIIGIGSSPYDACVDAGWDVKAMNYAESAKSAKGNPLKDRSGLLTFANLRAYWIWLLMERLDPQHGATLMLPPDPKLKADLASFRRKNMDGGVVKIEGKDDIKKRLGRSPDRGEAVIYALSPDPGILTATASKTTRTARSVRY